MNRALQNEDEETGQSVGAEKGPGHAVSSTPRLMLAVVATQEGGLQIEKTPTPTPQTGEVLVRVMASAVNPLDTKILAGKAEHARQPLPAILGIDMAGVVVAVGQGVTKFVKGDEIFGMAGGVGGRPGSLAEYMAADARLLARKPANLTMREAAALPLAFITAWEGLVDRAGIRGGQRVLIQGGAGSVGQMALQIATARDTEVYATGSAAGRTAIEELGAHYIDRKEPAAEVVARITGGEGFDVVFDTAGGASLDAAFVMVRRFGHVVSALGWGTHLLAPLSFRAATYSGIFTLLPLLTGEGRDHHGAILEYAAQLAEAGRLRPTLDARRYTLANVENAYSVIETGAARGKLVVDLGEDAGS